MMESMKLWLWRAFNDLGIDLKPGKKRIIKEYDLKNIWTEKKKRTGVAKL
jgi:hypothetical protein